MRGSGPGVHLLGLCSATSILEWSSFIGEMQTSCGGNVTGCRKMGCTARDDCTRTASAQRRRMSAMVAYVVVEGRGGAWRGRGGVRLLGGLFSIEHPRTVLKFKKIYRQVALVRNAQSYGVSKVGGTAGGRISTARRISADGLWGHGRGYMSYNASALLPSCLPPSSDNNTSLLSCCYIASAFHPSPSCSCPPPAAGPTPRPP